MTFQNELETLIRARYPIIYIITGEEMRVQNVVMEIAQKRQKKVFEWSFNTGVVPAGTSIQSQKSRNVATKDPLLALDLVIEHVEPAIFIFKDFHPFLTKNNFAVVRKLKEIALHLKNSFKSILVVSSVLEIPAELEKEVTVLNYPLPTREDLSDLLDKIIEDVSQLKQVTIELDAAGRERLLQASLGLTLGEAENVFAKIIVKSERLSGDDVNEVFAEKQQIIRKSGLLEYYATEENFAHVGGMIVLKDWLDKRASAFTEEARAFGLPAPKGILMLGVQGCGKSLCAKAVSTRWQLPLLRFDMGRMFGSLVGSSEENVRRAIAVAESVAPAILWVDEIDKAFAGSQGSGASDGGTTARVFGTFLTWLSEKTAPVFVVATANDISHLPPELLRKGRDLFCRPAEPGGAPGDFPDSPDQARTRCNHFRSGGLGGTREGLQRCGDRGSDQQRALRCLLRAAGHHHGNHSGDALANRATGEDDGRADQPFAQLGGRPRSQRQRSEGNPPANQPASHGIVIGK
jgi:hypothetical protein